MSRAAMQQALEALEQSETTVPYEGFGIARREAERKHQDAITSLRSALAEQAQPVATASCSYHRCQTTAGCVGVCKQHLYTTPPAPQPLTDEELDVMWRSPMSADWEHREYGRLVEAEVLKRMGVQR